MNKINNLIHKKNWHAIVNQYQPRIVAESLSFERGRTLAYQMLFNEERDDGLRDYAIELLQKIRHIHFREWSLDWKNDVFLGDACYLTMKGDEQFEAYKRAFDKAHPPPPSLLISLASCYLLPTSPVTLEEAENLAKKALEQEISIEGVVLLRGIYADKNQDLFDYWDKVLDEVEEKNIHTQAAWPDFSIKSSIDT